MTLRSPRTIVEHLAAGGAVGALLLAGLGGLLVWRHFDQPRPRLPRATRDERAPIPLPNTETLAAGRLLFPVPIAEPGKVRDTFDDPRGSRRHQAIDIPAPRGSPVVAVDDGIVARLSRGGSGGIALYHLDPRSRYVYYYAHLERHAVGLSEGQPVRRGQVVGYVGTTGNAPKDTPHLHFAMQELRPGQTWGGRPINPLPLWQ